MPFANLSTNPVTSAALGHDFTKMLSRTKNLWYELKGCRIFITGGTGFIGSWLLHSLLEANKVFSLGASAVLLSRNPKAFMQRYPELRRNQLVSFHQGDISDFPFPKGHFSHVIHAASDLSQGLQQADPVGLVWKTFGGCRRVMQFAALRGVKNILYISSGAVYGPMVTGRGSLPEDAPVSCLPHNPSGAYAEAKRVGELTCALEGKEHGISVKIARGFTFAGPFLPLNSHFAITSFIQSALAGRDILIRSRGKTLRSYLYGSDMAHWLWSILIKGKHARPYNVGSDEPVTIQELAETIVAAYQSKSKIQTLKKSGKAEEMEVYVPDIRRAQKELNLNVFIGFEQAIRRTCEYYKNL